MSSAGLGIPSNTSKGIAEGLEGLISGTIQGKQLAIQQQRADQQQKLYELAVQRAMQEAQVFQQGQDQAAQFGKAQEFVGGIGQAPTGGGQKMAEAGMGKVFGKQISAGLKSASMPMGQKADWDDLKKHHAEVLQRAGAIAGKLAPEHAQRFWKDVNGGLQEQAVTLRRSHVGSTIHDLIAKGAIDPPNPVDGAPTPDEQLRELAGSIQQEVEQGLMDPEEGLGKIQELALEVAQARVEIQQRRAIAAQAQQGLAESGELPTDDALMFLHSYETGQIDRQQFQKDWPHYQRGEVQVTLASGREAWVSPEQAEEIEASEAEARAAITELRQAQAQKARAEAQAKSPIGQMLTGLGEAAKKAKPKADPRDEAITRAMKDPRWEAAKSMQERQALVQEYQGLAKEPEKVDPVKLEAKLLEAAKSGKPPEGIDLASVPTELLMRVAAEVAAERKRKENVGLELSRPVERDRRAKAFLEAEKKKRAGKGRKAPVYDEPPHHAKEH